MESELFGHERGAFTGAGRLKRGMLELAEAGTILLNEIGELDYALQAKLLSFLDTRSFIRVGGSKEVSVNARIIAASHRDLERESAVGRFLEPLFFRLSVFPVTIPPLRDRLEDLPLLVRQILDQLGRELQLTDLPAIDKSIIERLSRYSWPGNVRELRNVLERSLILWAGGEFSLALPDDPPSSGEWSHMVTYPKGRSLRQITDEVTRKVYEEALRRCSGNRAAAARELGLSRASLYRLAQRLEPLSDNSTQ
jgi:transcriptional regulator with PAS, ATPase and Fis domain